MKLSEYAKTWVGKNFNGHSLAQCMLFVRHCLQETDAAIKDKVTDQAVDGLETSYALASSLAGRDIGQILTSGGQPDDIYFFKNTYGNWPEGTITHVGIAGTNGSFIHRPTSERPVEQTYLSGYWEDHLRCILRWDKAPAQVGRRLKWFKNDNGTTLVIDKDDKNQSKFFLENVEGGQLHVNGTARKLLWAKLELGFE